MFDAAASLVWLLVHNAGAFPWVFMHAHGRLSRQTAAAKRVPSMSVHEFLSELWNQL